MLSFGGCTGQGGARGALRKSDFCVHLPSERYFDGDQ